MILDAENQFSAQQSLTTGSENGIISTNVLDLGVARNIGVGAELYIAIACTLAMTSSSSDDTLAVDLVTDDNADMNSPVVIQRLGVFPAVSAAGTVLKARVPISSAYERYIALKYTAATGPLTQGKFTAGISLGIDAYTSYAEGITITG